MNKTEIKPSIFKYQGRDLGYLDLGPKDGHPIIFFHGFPGSSYQALTAYDYLEYHRIRLIAFDRPGYGYSHSAPQYHYQYLTEAMEAYVKGQNFNKVSLLGVSGGSPYAIATAAAWGETVKNLVVVCGLNVMTDRRNEFLTEFQRHGLNLARFIPAWQLEILLNFALSKHKPIDKLNSFLKHLDLKDRSVLNRPEVRNLILHSMEIARLHGPSGIIFDGKNYSKKWHVNLQKIKAQSYIFHGDQDRILNHRMAQDLAQAIPNSYLKIWPGEGHYSLPISRINEILNIVLYGPTKKEVAN